MSRVIAGGRYAIGAEVGAGGMGVVYDGEDLIRGGRVAVKVLRVEHSNDGVMTSHMEREARVGGAVCHPNVVAVLDTGYVETLPYIVMEYVDGRSLGVTAAEQRLRVTQILALVQQIVAGLGAIHRAGYIHGDLKSDNVLVSCRADGTDVATIIDLGLAGESRAGFIDPDRAENMISGTPDYMAPELVEGGRKTAASDLYAVGVILYELLTGATPFGGGTSFEIMRRHVDDPVIPPTARGARIPSSLERVVMRALAKQPSRRYRTAAELAADLAAVRIGGDGDAWVEFFDRAASTDWTRPALPFRVAVRARGTQPPPSRQEIDHASPRSDEYPRAHVSRQRSAARRRTEDVGRRYRRAAGRQ